MEEVNHKRAPPDVTDIDDHEARNHSMADPRSTRRTKPEDILRENVNATLANPLAFMSPQELREKGREYALKHYMGDEEDIRAFELGALIAQDPQRWQRVDGLTAEEQAILSKEQTSRWSQPKLMYYVIAVCSLAAAVQGMDETVVNGAQVFYDPQFGLDTGIHTRMNANSSAGANARVPSNNPSDNWIAGLVNACPYICCAFVGCWLTVPFNNMFGRRGTVFLTCLFSAIACFWQGFVNSWWSMAVARFALGLGIGPKSATVPMYAAETTPPAIRGALVMQWQMWTAFGIMCGLVSDLIFFYVPDTASITGLNWRIMMASAMFPAVVVCLMISKCPESPRWYISRGKHFAAYDATCRLRFTKVQAARDIFYMQTLLEAESAIVIRGKFKVLELVRVPRNRRAFLASEILMFMQQFCGINVIAYYSSGIYIESGLGTVSSLVASLGYGTINFLFAIPAIYTIDTYGRRKLLLITFPFMALFMFFTAFSFYIPSTAPRVGCVTLGMYIFTVFYSPGMGPVPFTYSAEAYPLYIRPLGMSVATATLWFFNALLSITWPALKNALTPAGGFSYYAGWNVIGFILVLLILPETKEKTLEELDQVFAVPTRKHAAYGLRQILYFFKKYLLRKHAEPEVLYKIEGEDEIEEVSYGAGGRRELGRV